MNKKSSYEGLQAHIRKLKTPAIEVWRNEYSDKCYDIHIEIPEFTCICPKTGLPDFAVVTIEYSPAKSCVELKSLKEYMMFYRSVGIFHEHFANKVMEDFIAACRPRRAKIVVSFNPRGGIATTVTREYKTK
ncbi:MAG: preQ(1) synthase [Candidatus Omnitrophota bacterium]